MLTSSACATILWMHADDAMKLLVALGLSNIGAGQWPAKFVFRQRKGRDGVDAA